MSHGLSSLSSGVAAESTQAGTGVGVTAHGNGVSAPPATVVYLSTVKQQRFEVPPDFLLDWRDYFEGDATKRGHRVLDQASWNGRMLPELRNLEAELNDRAAPPLIRV